MIAATAAAVSIRRYPSLMLLLAMSAAVVVGLWQVSQQLLQEQPYGYDGGSRLRSTLAAYLNQTRHVLDGYYMLESTQRRLGQAMERARGQSDGLMQRVAALEAALSAASPVSLPTRLRHLEARARAFERHLSLSVRFRPLKDPDSTRDRGDHMWHYFMSRFPGRGYREGPPELLRFPSGELSQGRLLCLVGNDTSDGTRNRYGFAFPGALPGGFALLRGRTLVADTFWDFANPWHAMYNLLQFVHWRVASGCPRASRLVLFHKGELRRELGGWIRSVLRASGLPSHASIVPYTNPLHASSTATPARYQHAGACFEDAIVSRSGIGGMEKPMLGRMFTEARCQARVSCGVKRPSLTVSHVNVTLVVRRGGRGFVDEGAWRDLVKGQCQRTQNCTWSVMYVANLTFCQQVEHMSYTDILVSAHGAQLTNMIFMSPGGHIMEMFPAGWLELAGHGQYIYRNLAHWLGLHHEGYWRDPKTPPCPDPSNAGSCFTHYKDQPLGINATHISGWLGEVIANFRNTSSSLPNDDNHCECPKTT